MTPRWKLGVFWFLALCLAVLVSEGVTSLAATLSPALSFYISAPWKRESRVADPDLGFRMTPHYPGNDAWGFRNRRVPEQTDVLALGDSMTYGFAAPPARCWPRQLERMVGKTVYNMSCGRVLTRRVLHAAGSRIEIGSKDRHRGNVLQQ